MLSFSDEIRKAFIDLAQSTKVYLEGNILKLIDPGDDSDFRAYLEEAVRRDKLARQRRLAITKQIQQQNKELIYHDEKNQLLNDELKLALIEQQKSKDQLIETLKKVQKQNKDLAQFSWMISHNLRGPLASSLGIVNLMRDFNLVTPDNQDMYDHLKSSILRMDEILHDVSVLLEIRNDPPLLNETIDLGELLNGCLEKLSTLQEQSGVKLRSDFSCCSSIFATRIYLESILISILSNAMQYCSNERLLEVAVFSDSEPGFCVLKISDNGAGISKDNLEKIFEPFRKLDERSKGKGNGLYLARSQAEAMGGSLSVESELGKGSTFILRLPSEVSL